MDDQESTAVAPAPSGGIGEAAQTWRSRYWKLCGHGRKTVRELTMRRRLAGLRRRAVAAQRYRPGCVDLDGFRIAYDDLLSLYMEYKHIFAWGIYDFEPRSERPRVLDCGSHIGMSVLRFKRVAPGCRVVAFEPDASVLELLHRNIEENSLRGIDVVPAALADGHGTSHFVPDGADGGALTRHDYAPPSASVVPTVPLSDYLDEPVDLLKMNIEGAEGDVLQEAASKLHNVRQMVVEYHGFPECGQRLHEILALLDACGFRYALHHFDYETNGKLRPPFRIDASSRFFQLIAATRVSDGRTPSAAREREVVKDADPQTADTAARSSLEPVSRRFGFDRGTPIDRHYIESFLDRHRDDIRGRVLEVGGSDYTRGFGQRRVERSDVLHVNKVSGATVVADLTRADNITDETYDCFIMTQTLPFVYDVRAALRNTHRILKRGGVLLLTVPGISQLSRYDMQRWGDFWRFTPQSVHRLLADVFDQDDIELTTYGNVRSAAALLDGRAAHELPREALDYVDEEYPVIIAARAVRRR